jgi:cyclophilin family peptidyl-prolyl cis-trans isomerase
LRRELKLAPFYTKHISVDGLPILASAKVRDAALLEAAWIVRHMLANRSDILRAIATNRIRLAVMAYDEFTTDIPEHSDLKPANYWDRRARGLGATDARPAVSCAEENLLNFPGDPYSTENILVHEFGHVIHEIGMRAADRSFDRRLRDAFTAAKKAGLWKGTYAGSNASEYWAEGVQSWFGNNRENDALHNHVNTRTELREYDSRLATLLAEVFGTNTWRYQKPMDRPIEERTHLADYDTSQAPRFRWRSPRIAEKPRVLITTELGDIELELDAKRAPITASNFLHYVQEGYYSDGIFHRTVTLSNQPHSAIKIQVIQAAANPRKTNELAPPILLERTRDTGLKHRAGTISMARDGPHTAQDEFFICIDDEPELDYGGKRNPDGQGFGAFGRVIKGMDTVRKIHTSAAEGQSLRPPIRIQRAIRND